MRKDEWVHISLGTELEPWPEHNLVNVDGTPLLSMDIRHIQWISL